MGRHRCIASASRPWSCAAGHIAQGRRRARCEGNGFMARSIHLRRRPRTKRFGGESVGIRWVNGMASGMSEAKNGDAVAALRGTPLDYRGDGSGASAFRARPARYLSWREPVWAKWSFHSHPGNPAGTSPGSNDRVTACGEQGSAWPTVVRLARFPAHRPWLVS
jgi:hypothetical protein